MREGTTCYERDEELCEDQMCLRVGCRLRNERLGRFKVIVGGKKEQKPQERAQWPGGIDDLRF